MTNVLRTVGTTFVVAGKVFPVCKWKATLASQGNMGAAQGEGAYSDLVDSGLDIFAASGSADGAEFDIYAGYNGNQELVFSGIVDSCEIDVDENKFEIVGRDFAAVLADGKQTVAGLNYRNQSIAQIVTQIANKMGLTPNVTDPGIKAGPTMNGENSFNPSPTSYWTMIQGLAEDVGYECYVTPDRVLYFGPPVNQGTIDATYGALPGGDTPNPCWGLKVTYNPRNNSNIVVKVMSHDSQRAKTVSASSDATQVSLSGTLKKTRRSLTGGNKTFTAKGGSGGKIRAPRTTHYIHVNGMTPERANARAKAQAEDLAKHQIVVGLSLEGNFGIKIHSSLRVDQIAVRLLANVPLNVAEVTHEFSTPDGGASGGFVTSVRALAEINP